MDMKFTLSNPPRRFTVGERAIELKDCGRIALDPDEQITHVTESGAEFDVVRKNWGFYGTPSLNGRLARFGLRGALVKNPEGRFHVLLVEREREQEFQRYLADERASVVSWLDRDEDLRRLEEALRSPDSGSLDRRCVCDGCAFDPVFSYDRPSTSEVRFGFAQRADYRRTVYRCRGCGHLVSAHTMGGGDLYGSGYVDANYGDEPGILAAFTKIMALPPERSDNAGRVKRILEVCASFFPAERNRPPSLLDLGSGLCVFPAAMKASGWTCTAVDQDRRLANHARQIVGVEAICSDILELDIPSRFDLVTFNKVIEHYADPIAMLRRAHEWIAPGGLVYVEVPDGDCAAREGADREEFTIDHEAIFSLSSLAITVSRSGFDCLLMERVHEPSGKYTLRTFMTAATTAGSE